jgi:hypothetical protein
MLEIPESYNKPLLHLARPSSLAKTSAGPSAGTATAKAVVANRSEANTVESDEIILKSGRDRKDCGDVKSVET